jgi:two-component system, OmpR family, phosphate regulon sensor histidine kinase PhoR
LFWLLPRILTGAVTLLGGAWVGSILGRGFDAPLLSALLGSCIALSAMAGLDAMRGYRLIRWLRGPLADAAPADSGLWGEIGYRMERSMRSLESEVATERLRLTQFLSAIEASPNGVMLLDSNQQIEWFNTVAAVHFGLDSKRDLRQSITNLVRAPEFVAYLHAGRFEASIAFAGPSGRGTLSVLIRPYGEHQLLVLSQDITEREKSDAMRRDFVANVSHEIRTPLTVLAGFIETMSSLELTEVERKRSLTLMAQQTQRMLSLVSDLLTLAQLEGSAGPPVDQWVPLNRVLQQATLDAESISAGRHSLKLQLAQNVQLAGSEPELLSAIGNLLNNAVRHTPAGEIKVSWRVLGDGAGQLEVSDTGPGIAREHLSRLTERFYRVDASRSRDTGGTGLGLAIVKHVLQRHGAELRVESELGKGSSFQAVFPPSRVRVLPPPLHADDSKDGLRSPGAGIIARMRVDRPR